MKSPGGLENLVTQARDKIYTTYASASKVSPSRGETPKLQIVPGDFVRLKEDPATDPAWKVVAVDESTGILEVRQASYLVGVTDRRLLPDVVAKVKPEDANKRRWKELQELHELLIKPIALKG